jgi:hypothetical protein
MLPKLGYEVPNFRGSNRADKKKLKKFSMSTIAFFGYHVMMVSQPNWP